MLSFAGGSRGLVHSGEIAAKRFQRVTLARDLAGAAQSESPEQRQQWVAAGECVDEHRAADNQGKGQELTLDRRSESERDETHDRCFGLDRSIDVPFAVELCDACIDSP